MKLVLTLVVRDDADIVEEHLTFHLNAGVDLVIASDHSRDGTRELLEPYVSDGHLVRVQGGDGVSEADERTRLARSAATEHGADWVIDSDADEFWLPRAESLKDVLVAIPPRYGVVQGLQRVFLPRPDDGRRFPERMSVRRAPYVPDEESAGRLDWALRPIHRASPTATVDPDRKVAVDGQVPLRAWYPVEVLRFPLRSPAQLERRLDGRSGPLAPRSRTELAAFEARGRAGAAEIWSTLVLDDDAVSRGLGDGSLVEDERLHGALGRLEAGGEAGSLGLSVPNVVDDVAYAGECAAVREVDFEPLLGRIAELEERLAVLERRLWPQVRGRLARLVRR